MLSLMLAARHAASPHLSWLPVSAIDTLQPSAQPAPCFPLSLCCATVPLAPDPPLFHLPPPRRVGLPPACLQIWHLKDPEQFFGGFDDKE